MMLPQVANAVTVAESDVNVKMPDGTADCYFVHPASGTAPGFSSGRYLRAASRFPADGQTARGVGLFGARGESVYRVKKAPTAENGAATPIPGMTAGASAERDHAHDRCEGIHRVAGSQPSVAKNRKIGTQGY